MKKTGKQIRGMADEAFDKHRRAFMRTTALAAGLLSAGIGPFALAAKGGNSGGGQTARNPLRIPPTIAPGGAALSAAPASVNLGGGKLSSVLAYNGFFAGPTFRANSGDVADIAFTNGLAAETTIHWHGLIVPPAADGHPMDAVMPGARYAYQFPVAQRAGLNWYHPHPHMKTGEQVALGLAGAFIVNDAEEAALNLPSGLYEVPLILRDANFDSSGNLSYTAKSSGFLGKTPLVNGTLNPQLQVDTAIYRFRVLNGANARVFRLALSNGAPFVVIGNDGGLLDTAPVSVAELEISPGERLDILVDFRDFAAGDKVMLRCLGAGWDLLEFAVERAIVVAGEMPTGELSTITPLADPVLTREFSFDGMSRINGRVYDMHRIDFQVPLGQTERWRFKTGGNAPHPVHVHGASFQVVSRTGGRGRVLPWERGWKDTVLLQDGETVDVLIRFEAHRGLYVMHCHKLEHEDMGMMVNFEVI